LSKGETYIDRETENQSGCETEILRKVETEKQSNGKTLSLYCREINRDFDKKRNIETEEELFID
jgi:hypothetical protein